MKLFDIKEDEVTEAPFRNMNSDFDCEHSVHVSRNDICPKKNGVGTLSCSGYAHSEFGCDNASKLDNFVADDFNKRGEGDEVTFDLEYVSYRGKHYTDSRVRFSSIHVEAWSERIYENGQTFHIVLDVEDIVKIESEWSARCKIGTITISFILKDAVEHDGHHSLSASGIHELVFPSADIDWYQKLEAIESLDGKYRALWKVTLDTGVDQPVSPEQGDVLVTRNYFPDFDGPFEEVIYPQGDPDAVSISKRDVEVLFPDTFLNDTIIDFYIKYLKTKQSAEQRTKFHFFNCFFFRKLADVDKDPSSILDGRAAFLRVRKWTRKVKLDEKDFIFIPVNYGYHWSLIVICYFAEVANYTDSESNKLGRVPCILHMDSLRGTHAGLKDLFQSYLLEEWKERRGGSCDDDHAKFRNMKFVSLELPQQQNTYDCGLFLLHYVELFLEGVSPDFSIYNITPCSKFLQSNWFPPEEASMKRSHIERLISGLIDIQPDNLSARDGKEPCSEELRFSHGYHNDAHCWRDKGQLHHAGEGIEMTLLPSSSTNNTQCTRTSGLVLSSLLQPTHAYDGTSWDALESRLSIDDHEIKKLPILRKDDADCLISAEHTQPVFRNLNNISPATADCNSSGAFLLEADHIPSLNGNGSSPIASELLDAPQTNSYHETGVQNRNPLFLEADLMSSAGHISSSYSKEQQVLKRMRITDSHYNGGEELFQHALKRMHNTTVEGKCDGDNDVGVRSSEIDTCL